MSDRDPRKPSEDEGSEEDRGMGRGEEAGESAGPEREDGEAGAPDRPGRGGSDGGRGPDDLRDSGEGLEIRAVLLDLGGVILDLGEARGVPWGDLDRRGREALVERIREGEGTVEPEDLDRLLFGPWRAGHARRVRTGREEPWGPHLDRLRRHAGVRISLGGMLETWARPYLDGLGVLTGAQEALARLAAADLRLALVSNVPMPGSLYARVLERHGLAPFFEGMVFSYDERARKPGPALLYRALDGIGIEPEAAIMVGDRRSRDVAAGEAAGARTVWIEGPDDRGPEPDATIGSIVELPALLGL